MKKTLIFAVLVAAVGCVTTWVLLNRRGRPAMTLSVKDTDTTHSTYGASEYQPHNSPNRPRSDAGKTTNSTAILPSASFPKPTKDPTIEAVFSILNLDEADRPDAMRRLAVAWGVDLDTPDAREYLATTGLAEGLGVLVAARDPAKGVVWAEALTGEEARRQILHDSLRALARTDVPQAIAFFQSRTDHAELVSLASGIALGWSESAPEAALAWCSNLGDAETRSAAQRANLMVWSRTDIDSATRAAMSLSEEQRINALGGISLTLLARNGAEAIRWANNLPAGPVADQIRALVKKTEGKR